MRKTEHKHLGMILDDKLNIQSHVKEAILKARRGIGLVRYLSKYVSRHVLDQMYKLYVRPHLDYGDIVYHKYDPEIKLDTTKRLERTQYSAALAVTGAWRGTSRQRLFENWDGRVFIRGGGIGTCVISSVLKKHEGQRISSMKFLLNAMFHTTCDVSGNTNQLEEPRVLQVPISKTSFLNGICWIKISKTPILLRHLNENYLQLSDQLKYLCTMSIT